MKKSTKVIILDILRKFYFKRKKNLKIIKNLNDLKKRNQKNLILLKEMKKLKVFSFIVFFSLKNFNEKNKFFLIFRKKNYIFCINISIVKIQDFLNFFLNPGFKIVCVILKKT